MELVELMLQIKFTVEPRIPIDVMHVICLQYVTVKFSLLLDIKTMFFSFRGYVYILFP
jgi:hypothetical protein